MITRLGVGTLDTSLCVARRFQVSEERTPVCRIHRVTQMLPLMLPGDVLGTIFDLLGVRGSELRAHREDTQTLRAVGANEPVDLKRAGPAVHL